MLSLLHLKRTNSKGTTVEKSHFKVVAWGQQTRDKKVECDLIGSQ